MQIDDTPPEQGQVWDGLLDEDTDYSAVTTTVSGQWMGFVDTIAPVDHYVWCVGTAPALDDVLDCRNVGLQTYLSSELTTPAQNGECMVFKETF